MPTRLVNLELLLDLQDNLDRLVRLGPGELRALLATEELADLEALRGRLVQMVSKVQWEIRVRRVLRERLAQQEPMAAVAPLPRRSEDQ